MKLTKLLRYLTAILMVGVNLWNYAVNDYAWPVVSRDGAYLMTYFVGNAPEEQRLHFAVSTDGYNFAALNNNEAVIEQTLGTGCVRDPYILKAKDENGRECYYIVATDMDAMQGWVSNHAIIFWKSYDLINWEDEFVLDIRNFEGWEGCTDAVELALDEADIRAEGSPVRLTHEEVFAGLRKRISDGQSL